MLAVRGRLQHVSGRHKKRIRDGQAAFEQSCSACFGSIANAGARAWILYREPHDMAAAVVFLAF